MREFYGVQKKSHKNSAKLHVLGINMFRKDRSRRLHIWFLSTFFLFWEINREIMNFPPLENGRHFLSPFCSRRKTSRVVKYLAAKRKHWWSPSINKTGDLIRLFSVILDTEINLSLYFDRQSAVSAYSHRLGVAKLGGTNFSFGPDSASAARWILTKLPRCDGINLYSIECSAGSRELSKMHLIAVPAKQKSSAARYMRSVGEPKVQNKTPYWRWALFKINTLNVEIVKNRPLFLQKRRRHRMAKIRPFFDDFINADA